MGWVLYICVTWPSCSQHQLSTANKQVHNKPHKAASSCFCSIVCAIMNYSHTAAALRLCPFLSV